MKRMSRSLFVAACLVLSGTAWTAEPETSVNVTKSENGASVQGTSKVTATIVGIDAATRTVTLKTRSRWSRARRSMLFRIALDTLRQKGSCSCASLLLLLS